MIKKFNVILVFSLLLLLSVSAVSAQEDANFTLCSDESISDVSSDGGEVLRESNSHTVDVKNYNSYFNYKSGELTSSDVKEGDTIYLNGTFDGGSSTINFVFTKKVNVVGTQSNFMKNSVLKFTSGASGSSISNLNISNTNDYCYGIFLNGASDCVIKDCFIRNTGQSSYAVCIANDANHNNVTGNTLQTYGITYGQGTRSTPVILLSGAHYNCISHNAVDCDDANAIYLSSYSGGSLNGGLSNFNVIYNNTVRYNVLPTSWGYGIQVMGGNNTIDSNTVIGGYRGISTSSASGNIIINNKVINLTGADFKNPGVESGGEYAIVGYSNSKIINNSIINAKVISIGSAISALDNSIIENNSVEVLCEGNGINAAGSSIIIRNNNISTESGPAIYCEGKVRNLAVVGNSIASQSGVGVQLKKIKNKGAPSDVIIANNTIDVESFEKAIDRTDVPDENNITIKLNNITISEDNNISKSNSYLRGFNLNTTSNSKITLKALVSSDSGVVNEGTVGFFIGNEFVGYASVSRGLATLNCKSPSEGGEYAITAVYTATGYLSSNATSRLLVDSVSIEVLADNGVVGHNITFAADVMGLYSIINEGTVTFYVDDEYLGTANVSNGSAFIDYVPMKADNYVVKAVYGESANFPDVENNASFTVSRDDSRIVFKDLNATFRCESTIAVEVLNSIDLPINEGYIIFFDGETQLGQSNVTNGSASLPYVPQTAGMHRITARFYADNFGDNVNSTLLDVSKANVILSIEDVETVLFSNPSSFTVNVSSNLGNVTEGSIRYYVNGDYVGESQISDGKSSADYTTATAGTFDLEVVYEETDNFMSSNASATFMVVRMPTALTGEIIIFDGEFSKTFTTQLKDNNSNFIANQTVKIEATNDLGESFTFIGVSDSDGLAVYDITNLTGGLWNVSGTYEGDENYLNSSFSGKLVIVSMDTKTEIGEIENATVNHTCKLKVDVHDEYGKPVGEGILSFYIDDVCVASINLSNQNNGSDVSDLVIEYIPSEVGPHVLSAVYEGTVVCRPSNSAAVFNVTGESEVDSPVVEPEVNISSLDKYSCDGLAVIGLPSDATGNVTLTVDGKNYTFPVENGICNVSIPALANGEYTYTITYSGDAKYSKFSKEGNLTVDNPANQTQAISETPSIVKEDTVKLTLKTVKVKRFAKKLVLQATLKINGKKVKGKKITFKFNGKKYVAKTNKNGIAKVTIKKSVLKKLKVGKKVKYQASYGKITVKKTARVKR